MDPGTRIRLADQGDGWFGEYRGRELTGIVAARIGRRSAANSWYAIQFDEPIELQEPGASTPSGLHVVRYCYALVASRWVGVRLEIGHAVSCFVSLVPDGEPLPRTEEEISRFPIRAWASATLLEGAA